MDEKSRDARPSADYTGKTVDEALKRASVELGLTLSELDYQVIKEASRSVFGLVRTGEAVVRVWLPVSAEEPDVEQPSLVQAKPVIVTTEERDHDGPVKTMAGNPPSLEQVSRDVLSTLLDKMGMLAAVEVNDRGGKVDPSNGEVSPMVLNIVGDDLGLLIGRRGETLRDLQFIVRLMVSRKLGTWPNFVLDVEGYKARRVATLSTLAIRMAEQVMKTGLPATLEPMPAHERRIIHLALRDNPSVHTESKGEGEERQVQILLR
ncbi:MAG: RNA-binding cell elongation regulator Jag/EloR [Anaerolineae bacterium]